MKPFQALLLPIACLSGLLFAAASIRAQSDAQQVAFAGLRAVSGKGRFNSVKIDPTGNLYLLLDQKDGVRILKADPSATQVLAEAHIGSAGDIGVALALDPSGNLYVTGTTTSASLPTSPGVPFPAPTDSSTNGFVAKFDSTLHMVFATYTGSGRMAPAAIAATQDRVLITGGIYAPTLPVTPSAAIRQPADGSGGNGFVEAFSTTGDTLAYATYLSGFQGDTTPTSIAADTNDTVYIAGYTTSSGYPTINAVIPQTTSSGSGFVTKLSPAGDGIVFSTFIPGSGITSLALDVSTQTLILSGSIDPGLFPISAVTAPMASTGYQAAVRMSLDGSKVLSSSLLAPGTQSVVEPAPDGSAWVAMDLTTPLLPVPAISTLGSSAAFHIASEGTVDRSVRFGGSAGTSATIPITITPLAFDPTGQPVFAGAASPTTSSSLLPTQTYDLPLVGGPSPLLPSAVHDASLPPGSNCGSLCTGSGAYLAKLNLSAGSALALSTDMLPNVMLRNFGSASAENLQIHATGFSLSHNCPSQLNAGAECNLVLEGGPGSLTVQASNAHAADCFAPSHTPLCFRPRLLSPIDRLRHHHSLLITCQPHSHSHQSGLDSTDRTPCCLLSTRFERHHQSWRRLSGIAFVAAPQSGCELPSCRSGIRSFHPHKPLYLSKHMVLRSEFPHPHRLCRTGCSPRVVNEDRLRHAVCRWTSPASVSLPVQ